MLAENSQLGADLSIVTVVLNDRKGLVRTIKSVQRQTGVLIQHIIVDGGSTDGSAELAKEASDVVIESRPDGGIYKAMQRGFDAASGMFVIFTNAGDALYGDSFLALAVNKLKYSKSGWGFGPLVEESQRGSEVWTPVNGEISVLRIAERKTYVPFPTVLINRGLIEKIGGFNFSYSIAGDFDLIVRLVLEELPIRWEYPIARFAAGGISYSQAPKAWAEERVIRKVNLHLSKTQVLFDWVLGLRRVVRWKLGRVLDRLQNAGLMGKDHWRERRALKIPEKYVGRG